MKPGARGAMPMPNGAVSCTWVPDPEAPAAGWLYVIDLDSRLWVQGVTRTRMGEWTLKAEPQKKRSAPR